MTRNVFGIAAFVVVALVVLIIGGGSFYTVSQGETAIVTRWGKVIDQQDEGLHFKLPLIDDAETMSYKTQIVHYGGEDNAPLIAYSRDVQQADLTVSVNYKIDKARAREIYSTVGIEYMDVLVAPSIPQLAKNVIGQFAAADIVFNREKVAQLIHKELNAKLQSRGITIESFQIENIDFTAKYEAASEDAAEAQAQVLKSRQQLEQAKVDAQKQVANAEAAAKAAVAQAEAAATARKLAADAEAYAVKANGEAQAQSIRAQAAANASRLKQEGEARAEALTAQGLALGDKALAVEIFRALAWDGKLPNTMVPGGALPFMSLTPNKQ